MPLIEVRYRVDKIEGYVLDALGDTLPAVSAPALTCPEGGPLKPRDIMIEFNKMNERDRNCKDIHVRVWAHDYPSRNDQLDEIRRRISMPVVQSIPATVSWYVWVLLAPTSYGSDTDE